MKAKDKVVILTGGTGSFGRFLTQDLLRHGTHVIMLVRADSGESARKRVEAINGKLPKNVEVYKSDLTTEKIGLSAEDYSNLKDRTTHILHAAASIRFNLPLEVARAHNVKTTENIIEFAKVCSNLIRFGFVSSALVAGNRTGLIKEEEFAHNAGFKNTYEQSKYEAEALVRSCVGNLPVVIFRPPLIFTPTLSKGSGKPRNFLSLAVSLILKGFLPFFPGTENSTIDVVNNTDTARIISDLMVKEHLSHTTYHITNADRAPKIKTMLSLLEQKVGRPFKLEFCGDMKSFIERVNRIPWYRPGRKLVYQRSMSFLPEAAYPKVFDNQNTLSELNIKQIGTDPVEILRSFI